MRTRSSYRKPRSVAIMLKPKPRVRRPFKNAPKPAGITNMPQSFIRQLANVLPSSNKLSLYRVLPSHLRNAIPKRSIVKINESTNQNIIRREREIQNLRIRAINDPAVQNFLRLANNYYATYPHLNMNRPNINVEGMRRITKNFPTFYGSGYYKRRANRFRRELEGGVARRELEGGVANKKIRITANWVGPFGNTGNKRYKYWMSKNIKFYPYQTRKGTMVINKVRYPMAKNKFIFNIPGYKY